MPTFNGGIRDMDFKEFVDHHVQATTKFKTAEDLLKNSKPLMFLWICFAVGVEEGQEVDPEQTRRQ